MKRILLFSITTIFILLFTIPTSTQAANNTYVNSSNFLDYFSLNGTATYDPLTGIVALTEDKSVLPDGQVGATTLKTRISLQHNFDLVGLVKLGNKTQAQFGADGMGFAFHKGEPSSLGDRGGGLGVRGLPLATGLVLDTYKNSFDPASITPPYVAIMRTDENGNITGYSGATALNPAIILDNQLHPVSFHYDSSSRQVHISLNGVSEVINVPENIENDSLSLSISASTSKGFFNSQQFQITRFDYIQAGLVHVRHVDSNLKDIVPMETLTGELGTAFSTQPQSIPDYQVDVTPENASGIFTANTQTITYVYKKREPPVPGAPITVRYEDKYGNQLAKPVTLTGMTGEPYEASAKKITGWSLVSKPTNAIGTFIDKPQTVTYTYERIPGGSVVIIYEDEQGNKLAPSNTLNGKLGDRYVSKAKIIDGWLIKKVPANATGLFTRDEQQVTYIYTQKRIIDRQTHKPNSSKNYISHNSDKSVTTKTTKSSLPKTGDGDSIIFVLIGYVLIRYSTNLFYKSRNYK